jgi:hypothetical protein
MSAMSGPREAEEGARVARSPGSTLRALVADASRPGSLAARARERRWQTFEAAFPGLADMSVIDLGGTSAFWASVPTRPAHLTLLNPAPGSEPELPWAETVTGDACVPPDELTGRLFDLVYSNSTIEHVGGHSRRQLFAEVVREMGDHLWVQTPYRYFPIEPHFVFPWFQHLPVAARTAVAARWPLMPAQFPTDRAEIREEVMGIELLSVTEMENYFPEASLEFERVGGIIKSLIAVG